VGLWQQLVDTAMIFGFHDTTTSRDFEGAEYKSLRTVCEGRLSTEMKITDLHGYDGHGFAIWALCLTLLKGK
jgi:hypothetical protein